MRVAIDCTHYLAPGGIRVYIANLLPALASAGRGEEWILYFRGLAAPGDDLPLAAGTGVRVAREALPRRAIDRLQNWLGWPRVERWTGPLDVFHGTHFHVPPARKARRVLTVHDCAYLRHPEYYANRRLNDYGYRFLLGHSLARAERVIASSHSTRRDLLELFALDEKRVWVVPFGADPAFRPLAPEERAPVVTRLGLDRPYVVYPAGSIDLRKNIERTLRAFAAAFPTRADRPLLVVTGVGTLPESDARLARELDLEGELRCLRVRYPDELRAILSGAEWGMYTSLYEGFGIPPLEMMACGIAVLASNAASIPEVTGEAALLVDPRSHDEIAAGMRSLHFDERRRAELVRKGRERVAAPELSWERAARQMLAAYRDDESAFRAESRPAVREAMHAR
ncbi:MAG: glycosyltransferase family 4 protein [Planctomycetes bacterium]|nr:glycosyltransferase family 4 protein [Planctomycetota bacterium]